MLLLSVSCHRTSSLLNQSDDRQRTQRVGQKLWEYEHIRKQRSDFTEELFHTSVIIKGKGQTMAPGPISLLFLASYSDESILPSLQSPFKVLTLDNSQIHQYNRTSLSKCSANARARDRHSIAAVGVKCEMFVLLHLNLN